MGTKVYLVPSMNVPRSGRDPAQFTLAVEPSRLADLLLQPGGHTYCEYLSQDIGNRTTKPYFDRDEYFDAEPAFEQVAAAAGEVRRRMDRIVAAVAVMVGASGGGGGNEAPVAYKVATRHGWVDATGASKKRYKLSFRPFVSGARIRCCDIPLLLNHKDVDQKQDGFWDASVYKDSEQLLATLYGHKGAADLRPLIPEPGTGPANVADYIVQVAPPDWLLLGTYTLKACQAEQRAQPDPPAAQGAGRAGHRQTRQQTADKRTGAADGFDKVELEGVQHLTHLLAQDGGLHQLFDNESFNGLRFQYAHQSPDGRVVSLYIRHSSHALCPLAGRVHQSNKASLIVNLARCRLTFRCFDDDCLAGGSDGGAFSGLVDLTAHLQPDTMAALFGTQDGTDAASEASAPGAYAPMDSPLIGVLTDLLRRSQAFAGVPDGCKLVIGPPQPVPNASGMGGGTMVSVRFRLGDRTGTLTQNTSVFDGSGNFVGMLVKDQLVPGPLSFVEPALPADASFAFNQISARDGQLKSLEPHAGYSLTLHGMYGEQQRNAVVSVRVPRKAVKNITQPVKVNELMQVVNGASADHVSRVLGDQFAPVVFNVQQNNQLVLNNGTINNNTITIAAPADPDDKYTVIIGKLDARSQESRLRKLDGHIYEPLPGAPCAYVKKWSYKDYINSVLKNDPAYRSSAWRHKEAIEYLDKYDNDFLPVLQPDRDLLSFANGVLVLSTAQLLAHDDPTLQGRVARNHIDQQYTGSLETPLLDLVLDAQFDREVADILCGLLGRLLFRVGQLDDWQVMPYLVGIGGTGKSLLLTTVEAFFHEEAVGEIAAQSEEVFGLDNLADKEVVIGHDMPEKLSKALKQEHMQSMTSGERLSVAVKGKKARHVRWTAPVVMASNHEPDYKNAGGQISRRMVTFRFEHVVENARSSLARDILAQELPAVVARCLACYHRLRQRVEAAPGFWAAMPAAVQSWQNRLSAVTNKLHEFLGMDDDERGCRIECVSGQVTWVSDFKEAYEACMEAKLDPYKQPQTFKKFGFRISTDGGVRENVCRSCKQVAKGRGEKCCDEYKSIHRAQKAVIYDMRLSAGQANKINF